MEYIDMVPKSQKGNNIVYCLGIDLGGTKIAAGVVQDNSIISYIKKPTESFSSKKRILANIIEVSKMAVAEAGINLSDIHFTGLAIPAPPEGNGEILPKCQNLPKLGRVRIRSLLMKQLDCEVALENDANCFVLGEWIAGTAQGRSNVIGLTLGTGVGVGILLNGKLYRGNNWCAGEIWDQPLLDGRILENSISGRRLSKELGVNTGMDVVRMARQGDPKARTMMSLYGFHVGWLLSFMGRLLDPELFVLGGSMVKAYDLFKEKITDLVEKHWKIQVSKLNHRASIIGATSLHSKSYIH